MDYLVHKLSLDMHKSIEQAILYVKEGDTKRKLYVALTSKGKVYEIGEGCTAVFSAKKENGDTLFNSCTIEDGLVVYEFTGGTATMPGKMDCEIKLYDADNGLITGPKFAIIVEEVVNKDGDVESSDEYSALTELISSATGLDPRMEKVEKHLDVIEAVGGGVSNMGTVNVRDFGAVGDGKTDDTEAFKAAVNFGKNVFIPSGTYLLTDFSVDTKCIITGENKNTTKLECNGISLNTGVELSQVYVNNRDTTKTAVFVNKGGCDVHDCTIYGGNIGLELAADKHIIGGVFRNLTIGYCKRAGVQAIASGNAQKNQILYDHLYIVNNGVSTRDETVLSTELESGHGMYIDGGYGVEIRNCVFEYNSGVGLYLGMTYALYGCNVTSPYFEYNKYAQLYINNIDGTYMRNVHISGDFYTDAGRVLPDNALKNRGLHLRLNTNLTSYESLTGNHFSSESGKTIAFNNRYCPNNLFPFDVIGEMKSDYIPLADYNGETVWKHGNGYHTLDSVPIHIEKGEYTVTLDLSTDSANKDAFTFYLARHPDGLKYQTFYPSKMGKDGSWNTVSFDASFNGVGLVSIQTQNTSSTYPVYIKNIRIVKKDSAVEAQFAEVDTKFAEVDTQFAEVDTQFAEVDTKFAEVDTKLNANRYCPENLFAYDVIGEMQNDRITFADYNGERVWAIANGGQANGYQSMYDPLIHFEKGRYSVSFDMSVKENISTAFLLYLRTDAASFKTMEVYKPIAAGEWRTFTFDFDSDAERLLWFQAYNSKSNSTVYIKNIRITRVDSKFAEVDTKFAEVDSKFTEVNTKLNANRYCPNNLFPFDVIGEAAGTDMVGDGSRMTLGEYNGETVWERKPGGVTLYYTPIYVEKGDYQLALDVATVEGNNDALTFGLTQHPDGVKVMTIKATTEWVTKTYNISFTKTGTCCIYALNASQEKSFYIRNIRIVRLYPAAPTA